MKRIGHRRALWLVLGTGVLAAATGGLAIEAAQNCATGRQGAKEPVSQRGTGNDQATARRAAPAVLPAAVRQMANPDPSAGVVIDYPEDGSMFPPDIAAPTFLWRDGNRTASSWRIEVAFDDGSPSLKRTSAGPRMQVGEIDPRAIGETNELPKLTPEQAAAHTWKPDAPTWTAIKKGSVGGATVTITGVAAARPGQPVSTGRVRIRTSKDPVGAPIFYRDVPLMPSAGKTGVIQPLATNKVSLIAWRLRDVAQPASRVLLTGMHTCANCHSFSRDGRTLGIDLDGPKNDKGVYALTSVQPTTTIRNEDVVAWSSFRSKLGNQLRVGFMSQVSPDGRYVVTTISPKPGADGQPSTLPLSKQNLVPLYYVSNFKDYRFLQVFYPTGGILVWYDRATKQLEPLPGASDPRYVQANATWSPDGSYLVFVRAEKKDPRPPGRPLAAYANDPNEVQIRYDLYRVPFNGGKGGTAEPVRGASANGMSNSFPKISPDGRWIVFTKAKNGLLMRPDGRLWIVPAQGGEARLLRCNQPVMNSWHSFSPNGRWLVFSSKSRSPYTQMYLTHIDVDGDDSPAILIENSTAANRAVNIPEFVNVAPDGFQKIDTPAADFYQQFNTASDLTDQGRHQQALAAWQKALALNDTDDRAHNSYAVSLASVGRIDEAIPHFEKALQINPGYEDAHNSFGAALMGAGRVDEAIQHYQKALELDPDNAEGESNLGVALAHQGRLDAALPHLERAVALDPEYLGGQVNLGGALLQKGDAAAAIPHFQKAAALDPRSAPVHGSLGLALLSQRRGDEAIAEFQKALAIDPRSVSALDGLGSALYYVKGRPSDALVQWRKLLQLQPDYVPVMVQAAWALATSRDPAVRNGVEAARLAERAVQATSGAEPSALDALAAAYAETGRFGPAVDTAQRALTAARQQSNAELAVAIGERLSLYQANAPFRDTH